MLQVGDLSIRAFSYRVSRASVTYMYAVLGLFLHRTQQSPQFTRSRRTDLPLATRTCTRPGVSLRSDANVVSRDVL